MLRKLLKYEIKATGRTLLPLYAALVLFAIISKFTIEFTPDSWEAPAAISIMAYISVLIGTMVMTFIVMIQRFYKNLLSDEGYLMFTLPSLPWKHIVSKLLVSMMWMVISGLFAVLSILIFAVNEIDLRVIAEEFGHVMGYIRETLGASFILLLIEILFMAILSLASGILIIYASIAIGHLVSRHKMLASIGAFIGLNTVSQILFAILGSIPILSFISTQPGNLPDFLRFADAQFHFILWVSILFFALLSALYFFIANTILSRRLNLE